MVFFRLVSRPCTILLLLSLAGCSGGSDGDNADASSEFDNLATPSAEASSNPLKATNTSPFLGGGQQIPSSGSPLPEVRNDSVSEAPPLETRTSLEGRWEVVLHGFGANLIGVLVDITSTEDGYQAEQVGDSPLGWNLTESNIADNVVHLKLVDQAGQTIDLLATFENGEVRGNAAKSAEGFDLASLRPSAREGLDENDIREPSPNFESISSVKPDENTVKNLIGIAEELGTSSLAYLLYGRLMNMILAQPSEEIDIPSLVEHYLAAAAPWGERASNRAHLNIGSTLAILGREQEQALQSLDIAEQGFGAEASKTLLSRVEFSRGLVFLNSESEDDRQQGLALLQKIHEENPYHVLAISRLAEFQEQQGQLQDALELHAELVALPSIPGNTGKLAQLWKELGNDPEELGSYLDEVYEHLVYQFAEQDDGTAPAPQGQRIVLGELFTGMTCDPCVAVDVATGALEKTFPRTRFLMLRYHLHSPGPDPLTVSDGEIRRDYYSIYGTPWLLFNGGQVRGAAGNILNSPAIYQSLRQIVAPLLEQTTKLTIELAADVDGDSIHLRAEVQGAEESTEAWRLRLCLAAESIHFPAPNGIRLHEMIVRYMPGGPDGIISENGTLSYEGDVTLEEIRDGILASLGQISGELPEVPNDLANLHLVAFVQDDDSREILQASSIPVDGSIVSLLDRD